MNLVIDSGNSRIKACLFGDGKKHSAQNLSWNDRFELEKHLCGDEKISRIIYSSVRSDDDDFRAFLLKTGIPVLFFEPQCPVPLKIDYKTPETLGRDRLAAACGAQTLYPGKNLLVIDAGTAITYDIVEATGTYAGGNISPGLTTRFRALQHFTGKLPLLEPADDLPMFGKQTEEAIRAGVQHGFLFEAEGFIAAAEKKYPGVTVVLTGGDSEYLGIKLKRAIFAHPDLVLTGLNSILEYNAENH